MSAPALLLSGLFAFSLFPQATLKTVDPGFKLESLNGKRIACVDRSEVQNVGGLDFDAIYARGVFDSTYVPATLYTGPLLDSLCGIVVEQHKAVKVGAPDSADYTVTLRYIKLHNRILMETSLSIDSGAAGGTAAFIRIDADDKFGFGGKGRFRKGFENLKTTTLENLEKDYARMLK